MTKPGRRERSLRVPLSDEELEMLHALTEATGISAATIVRTKIRELYAERFGVRPKKSKAPTGGKR